MASRTPGKPARPAGKGTVKTPGKDQIKGEKAPTSVLEIVPGKFNENDWLSLLENDETEDFIADIFEDIWKETSKQIQKIYIRQQLLPFTLMMTENALSSVIQWAFLERDEPKPKDSDFWSGDNEPIPCSMDNWGEGVVPACREEQSKFINEVFTAPVDQLPSPHMDIEILDENENENENNRVKHSSTASSRKSSIHPDAQLEQIDHSQEKTNIQLSTQIDSSHKSKPYNHDVLVIQTQPPKLEPLSGLFQLGQTYTNTSSSYTTPATTITPKPRRMLAPKASSQLGSDALASTTNITETTKSTKKIESKLFDEQHIEAIISKAPTAVQTMLKSILSRPPGYRELELDDCGNVISIARIDPDKLASRSVHVKCDIVKPRKSMVEPRPAPKQPSLTKMSRSDPKFASKKLVLPEKSTDVGDLIQPVPGVLYEDSKLKKGDPRRYKNGMSKYANFYDETRPLKPIARRTDLAIFQSATQFLRESHDDSEHTHPIPQLHRLTRIPPIVSPTSTSSA